MDEGLGYFLGLLVALVLQQGYNERQHKELKAQIEALHARLERSEERVVNAMAIYSKNTREGIREMLP
jgi:uncharacterized protein YPO0396